MRNTYFILRHGQTIHQTKKRGIVYGWPDDSPPAVLTKLGKKQVEKAVQQLKNEKIDLIFSSDILRTRQTAEIVARALDLKINYDERLRDINWGVYQGKSVLRAWAYYRNPKAKFEKAPPEGESWTDCQNRMVEVLREIEERHQGKNVLIISHGDPLWLLEGWIRGRNQNQLLKQRFSGKFIKTGELRKLEK